MIRQGEGTPSLNPAPMRRIAILIALLAGGLVLHAQPLSRADLAPRLIELETCWEQHRASESARLRACQPLSDGITAFFSNRLDLLAGMLTLACWSLQSTEPPSDAVFYAGSIGVRVRPVIDHEAVVRERTLPIQIFRYYEQEKGSEGLTLAWQVQTLDGKTLAKGDASLDATELKLPEVIPPDDYRLQFEIRQSERALRRWYTPLAVIEQLATKVAFLQESLEKHPEANPIERATVQMTVEVLSGIERGVYPETGYPLGRLMNHAMEMARRWAQNLRGWQPKAGDYWLSAPGEQGNVYFRLFLPRGYQPDRPIPLVIALHGAGGNEHLFFEGYGLGRVLQEAGKRGWAVVAPRSAGGLNHLWGALDAVKQLIWVDDSRVFLMGHSMGGAQTFVAVSQKPELFRAVAIFAGAGQPQRVPETMPVFMAVGEQELAFLKSNIERAYQTLKEKKLATLEFRRYNGCEHLMIVREALPDVFAFLERIARDSERNP